MKRSIPIAIVAGAAFLPLLAWMRADAAPLPYLSLTPGDLKWIDSPRVPGVGNALVLGDPAKPGPYIVRARYPAGFKLLPHAHADDRTVTVISGAIYEGRGDTFDESKLRKMPPGSFYTESAGVNHSVWAKDEEVVVQVYGTGPTSLKFAVPPGTSK